ncbi:hypothetical protein EJB05_30308, partial [Eragrostis curvula]
MLEMKACYPEAYNDLWEQNISKGCPSERTQDGYICSTLSIKDHAMTEAIIASQPLLVAEVIMDGCTTGKGWK